MPFDCATLQKLFRRKKNKVFIYTESKIKRDQLYLIWFLTTIYTLVCGSDDLTISIIAVSLPPTMSRPFMCPQWLGVGFREVLIILVCLTRWENALNFIGDKDSLRV